MPSFAAFHEVSAHLPRLPEAVDGHTPTCERVSPRVNRLGLGEGPGHPFRRDNFTWHRSTVAGRVETMPLTIFYTEGICRSCLQKGSDWNGLRRPIFKTRPSPQLISRSSRGDTIPSYYDYVLAFGQRWFKVPGILSYAGAAGAGTAAKIAALRSQEKRRLRLRHVSNKEKPIIIFGELGSTLREHDQSGTG